MNEPTASSLLLAAYRAAEPRSPAAEVLWTAYAAAVRAEAYEGDVAATTLSASGGRPSAGPPR
jgi:hypothetical protein